MATVTGYTAARMKEIEDAAIVSGEIVGDNLILTRFDETTVNAGNVRGPVGPTGPDGAPVGTIIMGGWTTNPSGYQLLDGSYLALGAISMPEIAAMYPDWVVGDDLQFPDTTGAVPLAGSSPGTVQGSMQHTLAVNNLPSHNHTGPSHQHTGDSHTHNIPGHSHTASSVPVGDHDHTLPMVSSLTQSYVTKFNGYLSGSGLFRVDAGTFHQLGWSLYDSERSLPPDGGHAHTITVDTSGTLTTYTPNAGGGSTGFAGTGNTGNTGSGAAVDHTPKHLRVVYAVKTS